MATYKKPGATTVAWIHKFETLDYSKYTAIKDPQIRALLPSITKPCYVSFIMENTHSSEANAIRRVILSEIPVKTFAAEIDDVKTNDEYIYPEIVINRLRLFPILQTTSLDARFEITHVNETMLIESVKTKEIKVIGGKQTLPCDETFTLADINAGKTISVRFGVKMGYDYQHGSFTCASRCASEPLDIKPPNYISGTNLDVNTCESDARRWRITFASHGTMEPKKIVTTSIEEIIKRAASIKELAKTIVPSGLEYILVIENESSTMGNLFMHYILTKSPDSTVAANTEDDETRMLTLRIRDDSISKTEVVQLIEIAADAIKINFTKFLADLS